MESLLVGVAMGPGVGQQRCLARPFLSFDSASNSGLLMYLGFCVFVKPDSMGMQLTL